MLLFAHRRFCSNFRGTEDELWGSQIALPTAFSTGQPERLPRLHWRALCDCKMLCTGGCESHCRANPNRMLQIGHSTVDSGATSGGFLDRATGEASEAALASTLRLANRVHQRLRKPLRER